LVSSSSFEEHSGSDVWAAHAGWTPALLRFARGRATAQNGRPAHGSSLYRSWTATYWRGGDERGFRVFSLRCISMRGSSTLTGGNGHGCRTGGICGILYSIDALATFADRLHCCGLAWRSSATPLSRQDGTRRVSFAFINGDAGLNIRFFCMLLVCRFCGFRGGGDVSRRTFGDVAAWRNAVAACLCADWWGVALCCSLLATYSLFLSAFLHLSVISLLCVCSTCGRSWFGFCGGYGMTSTWFYRLRVPVRVCLRIKRSAYRACGDSTARQRAWRAYSHRFFAQHSRTW